MSETPRLSRQLRIPLVAGFLELVAGAVLGPRSCAGGLTIYFGIGVVAAAVCIAAPWLRRPPVAPGLRSMIGAGISLGAWIAGFALGNFQIMCRLF